jgi:protein-disulfide isomerase
MNVSRWFASISLLSLVGCQGDPSVGQKLDRVASRLDDIDRRLATQAAAARPLPMPPPAQPDPAAIYAVPIGEAPVLGPRTARVTLVEAFEFACPFCDRVRSTIAELRKQYGDDLRVVYKQYVVHPQIATLPALAVCAAHKQGRFEPMMELIWQKGFAARKFDAATMETLATELHLSLDHFRADMNGEACRQALEREQAELARLGVHGTPSFFINGRFLSGALPIESFKTVIDAELAKARTAIADGQRAEDYYGSIVRQGKKNLQ